MISSVLLAAESTPFPVLPALIAIPLLTALAIALIPGSRDDYLKITALAGSSITAAFSIWVMAAFETDASLQFVWERVWAADLGASFSLGIDGISLFLVVLSGILFPIAIMCCDPGHDHKPYYIWLMVLMSGSLGVFMATDLLLFFLFFEVVLIPMYFLIGGWGHGDRVHAATKFFIYTMAGSALMLIGIGTVAIGTQAKTGVLTFNVFELAEAQALSPDLARFAFIAFALGFAVKVPLVPVHTWLPDAHTEAPTAGSVILAGVMLKLGTYGFIRFGLFLFPQAAKDFAPLFFTLGVIGIVYGAVVATVQKDLKRLIAYSSIAHLGFIILGIFAMNTQGLEGALLQMVNHGISTGALFILVGWIYERRHTREIAALSGLQSAAPIMAAAFTIVMLSSIGLPGLNGFVGEFLILLGAYSAAKWWTVVAVTGVILAALYLLWAYQRVFHGQAEGDNATMADLKLSEGLSILPLIGLIVFLGLYPKPVLERMEPAVETLVAHLEANIDGFSEPGNDGVEEPADEQDLVDAAIHGAEGEEGDH